MILQTAIEAALRSMILRNALSAGHLAAVLVDHVDELRYNGGRAVQYDREAGQTAGNFFQNVEAQLGIRP